MRHCTRDGRRARVTSLLSRTYKVAGRPRVICRTVCVCPSPTDRKHVFDVREHIIMRVRRPVVGRSACSKIITRAPRNTTRVQRLDFTVDTNGRGRVFSFAGASLSTAPERRERPGGGAGVVYGKRYAKFVHVSVVVLPPNPASFFRR